MTARRCTNVRQPPVVGFFLRKGVSVSCPSELRSPCRQRRAAAPKYACCMYANVALLSPPYACLTYALPPEFPPEFWRPGLRLAVPLGRSERGFRAAALLSVSEASGLPGSVTCKTVCWPLEDAPLLPPDLLALFRDMALRQGVEAGLILGHVLPQGLRSTRVRLHCLERGRATALSLLQISQANAAERQKLARAL